MPRLTFHNNPPPVDTFMDGGDEEWGGQQTILKTNIRPLIHDSKAHAAVQLLAAQRKNPTKNNEVLEWPCQNLNLNLTKI